MPPFAARFEALARRGERAPYRVGLAVLIFVAVTAIWFAPLIGSIGTSLLNDHGHGDATNYIRDVWGIRAAHSTPFTHSRDILNGAPEGLPESPAIALASPFQPLFTMATVPLFGLVASFNLFILLGFVMTATAGFMLLDWLGFGFLASLIGGYVISFNPWTFNRAVSGAPAFLHGWCLILLVYALLRLAERRTVRAAAFAGLAFSLCFLVAAYIGLIACAFIAAFLILTLASREQRRQVRRLAAQIGAFAAATVIPLVPAVIVYLATHSAVDQQLNNPIQEGVNLAAAPFTSYLLPSPLNPVTGGLGAGLRHDPPYAEKVMFFGYTTIVLAIIGLAILVRRGKTLPGRTRSALLLATAALPIAYYSSLPRFVHIGGLGVPTGSYAISHITSFYRAYARFGDVVGISLVVLAAAALAQIGRRHHGRLVVLALGALIVFELLPGATTTMAANAVSASDRWLATQPQGIVAHYPMPTDSAAALQLAGREYQATRFTDQPLFTLFGAGIGETREEAIRILVRYVTDPETPGILAAEHVRYVVVHDAVYRAEGARPPSVPPPFRLVKRFPGVRVFVLPENTPPADLDQVLEQRAAEVASVEGLAKPTITYVGSAFHLVATQGNGAGWHTLTGRGTIELRNDDARLRRSSITLDAMSSQKPRTLDFIDDKGAVLQRFAVGTTITSLQIGPFPTLPGTTKYFLTTEDHASKGWDVVLSPGVLQPLADYSVSLVH